MANLDPRAWLTRFVCLFVLRFTSPSTFLGHFGDIASDFVGLLPDIEMK